MNKTIDLSINREGLAHNTEKRQPQTEIDNSSAGALENGQMCFRLF